jgi:hypothetical protein
VAPSLFSPPQHGLCAAPLPLDLTINTLLFDATGGDPSLSSSNFSPHLARALLTQPDRAASVLPAFGDLRAAASATKTSRLPLVAGAVVSEARLVLGACFLMSQGSGRPSEHPSARTGAALYSWLKALLADGTPLLEQLWHWTRPQCQLLHAQLAQVVSSRPWNPHPIPALPFPMDDFAWDSRPQAFPAALCTFLHALRVGAPWTWALDSLAGLANGIFSSDGRVFAVPAARCPHGSSLFCVPMADPGDPEALTLFCSDAGLWRPASSPHISNL